MTAPGDLGVFAAVMAGFCIVILLFEAGISRIQKSLTAKRAMQAAIAACPCRRAPGDPIDQPKCHVESRIDANGREMLLLKGSPQANCKSAKPTGNGVQCTSLARKIVFRAYGI